MTRSWLLAAAVAASFLPVAIADDSPVPVAATALGAWDDRSAIVKAIPRPGSVPDYVFLRFSEDGGVITEIPSKENMLLKIGERNDELAASFEVATLSGTATAEEEAAVESHTFALTLVAPEGGSLDTARRMLRFAGGLIRAGAAGIFVNASGSQHGAESWKAMLEGEPDTDTLLRAFVLVVIGQGESDHYSCGMHVLGLPDVVVPGSVAPDEAATVMQAFVQYSVDAPALETGHTFSVGRDTPHYRLRRKPCRHFKKDEDFHNPFGVWRLDPVR